MSGLDKLGGLLPSHTPGTVPAREAVAVIREELRTATKHRKATSRFLRRHAVEVATLHATAAASAADRAEHHALSADPAQSHLIRRVASLAASARNEASTARSALTAYAASRPTDPAPMVSLVPDPTGMEVHVTDGEPDRAYQYRDTQGRIWHFEDVSWFAGWHISGVAVLFTWEHAQVEFADAFPLSQVKVTRP